MSGPTRGRDHPHPNPLPSRERGLETPQPLGLGYAKVSSRERGLERLRIDRGGRVLVILWVGVGGGVDGLE